MRTAARRKGAVLALGAILSLTGLTGCDAKEPGAAAIVDGRRITEQEVQRAALQVQQVPGIQSAVTPSAVLTALVLAPFVQKVVAAQGLGVSEQDARSVMGGVEDPDPSTVATLRFVLAYGKLQQLPLSRQKKAADALMADVRAAEIRINPRYGRFDAARLAVVGATPNWLPSPEQAPPTVTPRQ